MATTMGSAILRAFLAAFAATCVAWGSVVWYQAMTTTQNPFAPVGSLHRKKELQVQHGGTHAAAGSVAHGAENRTVAHSYRPPAFATYNSTTSGKRKPPPIRVMEQYMEWHSVDALRRDPHNRKFSAVFYGCPLEAGNRIHHFLASAYWSIVTNRTMLVKYWDRATCSKYGSIYYGKCEIANAEHDCDAILARAPWIPALDDWRHVLGLPHDPVELAFYATHPREVVNPRYPWGPGNDDDVRGVDVRYNSDPLVMFTITLYKISFMDPMIPKNSVNVLLRSEPSRLTNALLHTLGADFLFGMLQRYSFELTDAMHAAIPHDALRIARYDEPTGPEGAPYTIALHSRHIDESLDGCDVSRERECVNQLLNRNAARAKPATGRSNATIPCAVAVMSDRSCTISAMSQWLRQRGCQVHVARHDERVDFRAEHGPFAGTGFFQDVALATTVARSAFVGMPRSSSDVVLELMQFFRTMEAWERSNERNPDLSRTRVDVCLLRRIEPPLRKPAEANRTQQSP